MKHVKIPMFLLYSQFRIYLSFSVKIRSYEKRLGTMFSTLGDFYQNVYSLQYCSRTYK